MSAPHRALVIGAGAMARVYFNRLLLPFRDRLAVSGLVDLDPAALAAGASVLGLSADQCFTDMATAFERTDADCCLVLVTPNAHEEAITRAIDHGLPVLSEKPVADTWEACQRIARRAHAAQAKVQIVQNYRYTPHMLTLRNLLNDGVLGRVNYVVGRFADDYRLLNSWGAPFRHQISHALLIEGAVHHFDTLRVLTGGDCATLYGYEWNPAWSTSAGAFCNLYLMTMSNDTRAVYEGNGTAAGSQNPWHREAYRVEAEHGSVTVGRDQIVRIYRHMRGERLQIDELRTLQPRFDGHEWIINEFLDWMDGGATPATVLDDNLKSVAMVFAAIETSRTGQPVDVATMVADAMHA
jgi:predicted dehydrogenase